MKNISIFGSTGSIGRQTLEVISNFSDKFKVIGLSGGDNIELLSEQINIFRPQIISVAKKENIENLKKLIKEPFPEIYSGEEGLLKIASHPDTHLAVMALVGHIGLLPTIKLIKSGKDIALANKETLVIGGELIENLLLKHKVKLLPVDSEHSAIFQCLANSPGKHISRIILTASGGPFRNIPLDNITPLMALAHPTWVMGHKVTIDSATLMNKGFEVIEARWLFNVSPDQIDVLIHPQSIIHSLVEFKDKFILAQMSLPDMRLPIQYALSYPERLDGSRFKTLNLYEAGSLDFILPDVKKFPCLSLAYEALKTGGTMPAVLNAANEIAVSSFLEEKLPFKEISVIISKIMEQHNPLDGKSIDNIMEATKWGLEKATGLINKSF